MKYMFLIYQNEADVQRFDPAQTAEIMQGYGVFSEEARSRGALIGGDRLDPPENATTLRVRDGQAETTDGPFAETKEQLAGYYVLECGNLSKALEYAAKIPTAAFGSIEVRPIWGSQRPG